jgi:hypothetical protein
MDGGVMDGGAIVRAVRDGAIVRAVRGGAEPDTPTGGGAMPEAVIGPDVASDLGADSGGGDSDGADSGGAGMGGATVAVMVADMAGAVSRSGVVRSAVTAGRVIGRPGPAARSGTADELPLPLPLPRSARSPGLEWPAAEAARMAAASSGSGALLAVGGTA